MRQPSKVGIGTCPSCQERLEGKWEDCGIGAYEYWGARGTDTDWRLVCPECEEELVDIEWDVNRERGDG